MDRRRRGARPGERAERAPSLVVSTAHSALGAVRRQVRVGEVTVLLAPATRRWVREAVVDGIDLGAHPAAELDLTGRSGEDEPGERWAGTLPVARYAAFRTADPGDDALARSSGCPPALVRSLAGPVALGRVDVVRRDGAAGPTGPTMSSRTSWPGSTRHGRILDVRPRGPDDVAIERYSTHGLGLSADIKVKGPATLRWLHAHAWTYGFVNDVPSEAWHWTWRP